ncbi:MAG TPA: ATP-binding cassette domain-containing protein [Thermotogaceae bacterium]|nr:ATP-binding cassette domain-containing protein [Thermotogota bacterium]HEW91059.1 ATP-binding cassette domain-containing protein [Thermotogaceae bacterium]
MSLIVKNLEVKVDRFHLKVDEFDVKRGEEVFITGKTGAGKTVFIEALAGFHKISGGTIMIDGKDITHLPPEKRKMGIVYQNFHLFPHLNVMKNILFGVKNYRDSKNFIDFLIREFGIEHILERDVNSLSGGEKQRVAIVRALAIKPFVLMLDEPFSHIDEKTKCRILNILRQLKDDLGFCMIHVTHDFSVLNGGKHFEMINGNLRCIQNV